MSLAPQGEATVRLKDGRTLTLRRDLRAIAAAEVAADVSIKTMSESIERGGPSLEYTAALLFGTLRRHHPEITFDEAFDLLESDADALNAGMNAATKGGAAPARANPPRAAKRKPVPNGTGTRSSPRGAKKG